MRLPTARSEGRFFYKRIACNTGRHPLDGGAGRHTLDGGLDGIHSTEGTGWCPRDLRGQDVVDEGVDIGDGDLTI